MAGFLFYAKEVIMKLASFVYGKLAIEELLVSDIVLPGDEHAEEPALPAVDTNKVQPPDVREEELHTA